MRGVFKAGNFILICLLFVISTSFKRGNSLKGAWLYEGGVYNNKSEGPPKGYELERRYSSSHYDGFIIQKGTKTEKYESGDYSLTDDAYEETQTFSSEPSTLIGKKIRYTCSFRNDTLTFKGKLFDGTQVEEYWKKTK